MVVNAVRVTSTSALELPRVLETNIRVITADEYASVGESTLFFDPVK